MNNALQTIVQETARRLSEQLKTGAPAGLTALVIALGGLVAARVARWTLRRALRAIDLDGRLRRSSVAAIIDRRGVLSPSRIAVECIYWTILGFTAVAALSAFDANTAGRLLAGLFTQAPRMAGAAAVMVGGMWLGLYLGRSTLIWAVNEDLPAPRKLALAVRVLIVFGAAAVSADMVELGGGLLRSTFIVILGGVVLAASLAVGLGSRDVVRRYFEMRTARVRSSDDCADPEKLWHHL